MSQKIIGNMWDRVSRSDINGNFTDLYGKFHDFAGAITEDIRQELLEGAVINFIDPVETVEDLPVDVINGDTSFVTSTGEWQRWNGEAWDVVAETDPSEFISLQGEFAKLTADTKLFKDVLTASFNGFRTDVNNTIDDRLDSVQALVQQFIDSIEEQIVYVEDEGENEHGYYVRYSDGKQEVWCNSISQITDINSGSIFRSESTQVTFPKSFLSGSSIFPSALVTSYSRWAEVSSVTNPSSTSVTQYSYISGNNAYGTHVHATGRWK